MNKLIYLADKDLFILLTQQIMDSDSQVSEMKYLAKKLGTNVVIVTCADGFEYCPEWNMDSFLSLPLSKRLKLWWRSKRGKS